MKTSKFTLYEFCAETGRRDLLEQWDDRNLPLTPMSVGYGSKQKVWWHCYKGHNWTTQIKTRTAKRSLGCPICAGKETLQGYNDLATVRPDIAAEWNPTKNGETTPQLVTAGSTASIWWICDQGHEWVATVRSRTSSNCGCPVCAGNKVLPGYNDMATLAPEIAAEWHPTKNGNLTPSQVTLHSNKTVWWICDQGHEWSTPVARRVQAKCPYCTNRKVMPGFNDLETINPDAAAMWHNELNGDLKPSQVTPGARTRVWWQCKFGHVWKAKIYSVNRGSRCPVCAGVVKRGTHYNSASEVNRQTNTTR